jgi:TetR/AcrR family fatty acid metabolism transcriptional regulator
MNKRQLQKAQTVEKILTVSKALFIENGILNTTTLEIAKTCQVAHGTVFLHFKDKNTLIAAIFERELKRTAKEVYRLAMDSHHLDVLLDRYFLYLENEEDFLAVIAREFPFYPLELRRSILSHESILRHLFFTAIENGIKAGKFKMVDITTTISFLFGTITYYLAHKPHLVPEGSVIKTKKELIKHTFLQFLSA